MFYCWLSCLCFFIFFFPFPSGCSEGSSGVEGARNACPLSLICWNSLFLVRNTAWQELQTVFSGSSPASPIWNGWEKKDIWRIYRISPIWKQIFLGIVGNLKTRSNIVGWMPRLLRSESCHSGTVLSWWWMRSCQGHLRSSPCIINNVACCRPQSFNCYVNSKWPSSCSRSFSLENSAKEFPVKSVSR